MSIKQKAVKGAMWTAIQNWVGQAGAFIVFFVLARLLQPDDFGLVALANVFLVFLHIFLEQGFAQALIQRDELDPEHLDTAFWTNIMIGVFLASTSFVAASWIAAMFHEPQLAPILRCFSLVFVINAFRGTQQAILERQFDYRAIALRTILGIVVGGFVGVGMALAGFGVWSLVGQQVTNELIGAIVLWSASDWRPGFSFSIHHFRQLYKFGNSILAFNFVSFFNTKLNDFLISYFLGTTALGYYAISYRIIQAVLELLVRTSSSVALPTFSRLKHEPERFRSAYYAITRLTSAISFPIFAGIAVLAPELVVFAFGPQWSPAIPLVRLLSMLGITYSISFFKSSVLIAMGYPVWTVRLKILSVVINIIGFAIAYRWGIIAVTAAVVIRAMIVFPVGQWLITRIIDIPVGTYLKQFSAPLASSLGMISILFITKKHLIASFDMTIMILAISTCIGAIVYLCLIRVLSPQLFQDFLDIGKTILSKSTPNKKVV